MDRSRVVGGVEEVKISELWKMVYSSLEGKVVDEDLVKVISSKGLDCYYKLDGNKYMLGELRKMKNVLVSSNLWVEGIS